VTEQSVRLEGGSFVRREPKTSAGTRSITISSFTAHLMHDHLDRFAASAKDELAFPNGAMNPIASTNFLSNHFGPARRAAGLRCRSHDLRHTSVALAIASGAHPRAIQSRMGQSSINVTLDRYGHLFPELDIEIADAFGRQLLAADERRSRVVAPGAFGSADRGAGDV
jgi:integrase